MTPTTRAQLIERLNTFASDGCDGVYEYDACFRARPDTPMEWCPNCAAQEAAKLLAAPPVASDGWQPPLCVCGHHWDSHTGHTHMVGAPERDTQETHCACCYDCFSYRPAPPTDAPQEQG